MRKSKQRQLELFPEYLKEIRNKERNRAVVIPAAVITGWYTLVLGGAAYAVYALKKTIYPDSVQSLSEFLFK